ARKAARNRGTCLVPSVWIDGSASKRNGIIVYERMITKMNKITAAGYGPLIKREGVLYRVIR
ncbi:hypothetical protein P7H02_20145, partial [Paenibacillus larvae]|uniref:hypothetical protein n=1 Tax=Paenibacillus larvae TaxID=1464 RepID=UPI00288F3777